MFTNTSRAPRHEAKPSRRWAVAASAVVATGALIVCAMAAPASATTPVVTPNGPSSVNLGTAAGFSVLAAAAATIPGSNLPGEVGAQAAITDNALTAYGSPQHNYNDSATRAAVVDALSAYNTLSALAPTGQLSGDDLTLQVVKPGVYHRVAAYAMTTPVTFDAQGNSNAYFIMQGDAALNTTASTTMNLINGAQASHIFWVVRGAATLGASSYFSGTILSYAAVTVGATSHVCGRALSVMAAVTLDADIFCALPSGVPPVTPTPTPTPTPTKPAPTPTPSPTVATLAIAITSLATTDCDHPTISGTTTNDFNSKVTIVIDKKYTFTAIVTPGHTWTLKVIPTTLSLGKHTIVATTTKLGKTASASQDLIVVPVDYES